MGLRRVFPLRHAQAKEEGLIDQVRGLLDQMRQKGVWIEDSIYEQILEQAGEIIE